MNSKIYLFGCQGRNATSTTTRNFIFAVKTISEEKAFEIVANYYEKNFLSGHQPNLIAIYDIDNNEDMGRILAEW